MLNQFGDFTKKPADIPDIPSPNWTPDDIRAHWQTPLDELKNHINTEIVDVLNSNSGASNIGANTINGLSGNTIQALLEALKNYIDTHKTGSDHDTRYYTETEVNNLIDNLAGTGRTTETIKSVNDALNTHKTSNDHDGRYYQKSEVYNKTEVYNKSETDTKLQNVVSGQIPNGTITKEKLAFDVLTSDDLIPILNASKFTINIIDMAVELETLKGATLNGVTANIFIETFNNLNDINLMNGFYDSTNKRLVL